MFQLTASLWRKGSKVATAARGGLRCLREAHLASARPSLAVARHPSGRQHALFMPVIPHSATAHLQAPLRAQRMQHWAVSGGDGHSPPPGTARHYCPVHRSAKDLRSRYRVGAARQHLAPRYHSLEACLRSGHTRRR